ncbi:ribokinase [Telluribacter humicola]|uniref:ribokinase n=1 Tax=Telluribacter humicola TaxID=1720261 RepID=UPI001E39224A
MNILLIGSSNTDMVVKTQKLPAPGETVIGGTFLMNPGGKGANQAVAAARLGASVRLVAKVGNDLFGEQAVEGFRKEGIDTAAIVKDDGPSGVALITVDDQGENCIVVAPGANGNLQPDEVEAAIDACSPNDIVLLQLEIPLATVEYAIRRSAQRGLRVILNPAPAQRLATDLLSHLYLITPNETEAELLTGIPVTEESVGKAARALQDMGVSHVVITLGARGAYILSGEFEGIVEGVAVKAIDSTAAGDCFNGALAVGLAEGVSLRDSVAFACKAAALSVTRLGAQSSMPYRHEVS